MMKNLESKSIPQLKKELDKVFSLWIRTRDNGRCISCGIRKPIKEMQCGHYISRSHHSVRWDEQNCHCQCVGCNIFKSGNMPSYTIALQNKYGYGIIKELKKRGDKLKQWKKTELIEMINRYTLK